MQHKKSNSTIAILLFILILSLLPSCITIQSPDAGSGVRDSAALALLDSTLTAVRGLRQEIDILSDQSTAAIREVIKLEHIGVPAQEWLQYMAKQADLNSWSPRRVNVTTDLKLFKNSTYEVVKLQFSVDSIAPKKVYSNVITIYEIATAREYKYESLHTDLDTKAKGLYDQWFNKVRAELLAINTVEKMVANSAVWTISKIDGASYQIKGDGLGLGATALTAGEWVFYKNTNKKMQPTNDAATTLNRVISGQG